MSTKQGIAYRKMGVPSIDEQHGQLVSDLGRLLSWIGKGAGLAETFDAFESLSSHTRTHFEFEEQHMREHRYPKLAEHREQHRLIIFELIRLQSGLLTVKNIEQELVAPLHSWVIRHIDVEDLEYAEFLGTASR